MKVKIKLEGGIMPTKGTKGAAAFDLYLPNSTKVFKGRQVLPLYFSIELPKGFCAKIMPRSGYSSKGVEDILGKRHDTDIELGLIDEDYRGVVGVIVNNHDNAYTLRKGTRIAQMLIEKVELDVEFEEVENLSDTERGDGGFGSTGR